MEQVEERREKKKTQRKKESNIDLRYFHNRLYI